MSSSSLVVSMWETELSYASPALTLTGRRSSEEQWLELALTCSHCVLPREDGVENLNKSDQVIIASWTQLGVRPLEENAARLLRIDSPSARDKDGIDKFTFSMKDTEETPGFQNVRLADENGDFVIPADRALWKACLDRLTAFATGKAMFKECLDHNSNELGFVYAASGHREERAVTATFNPDTLPTIKDWALLHPVKGRSFSTNVEVRCHPLPNNVKSMDFLPRGEPIQPDTILYKIGRKTGVSEGRYAGLRTVKVAHEVVNGELVSKPTCEHSVLSHNHKNVFALPGDSGALVVTRIGRVVGLCFGGYDHGDVGYFTHIHDLLDDIEAVTGECQIRLER
ncbi:hypothetical protein BJX70DRAFT_397186 [Aspergillus crustosus]